MSRKRGIPRTEVPIVPFEANPQMPVQRVHYFDRSGRVWINGGLTNINLDGVRGFMSRWKIVRSLVESLAKRSGHTIVVHYYSRERHIAERRGGPSRQGDYKAREKVRIFRPDGTTEER